MYVTHDQSEALAISDTIAVINAGLIEQVGTPLEVFNDPDTLFVANFVGENNQIEGKVTKLEKGLVEVKTEGGDTLTYTNLQDPFMEDTAEEGEEKSAPKLAVGDKVSIVTRYDKIFLDEKATENVLTGTIRNLAYMGTMVQVVLNLNDGSKFTVNVSENLNKVMGMGLGSTVKIHLPESACFLFKDNLRVR